MFNAIDLGLLKTMPPVGEPHYCYHEHINLMVVRGDSNQIPRIVFLTKNDSYLMSVTFDGADCELDISPRSKIGVGEVPPDLSLYNALALYIKMSKAANRYIDENFHMPSYAQIARDSKALK